MKMEKRNRQVMAERLASTTPSALLPVQRPEPNHAQAPPRIRKELECKRFGMLARTLRDEGRGPDPSSGLSTNPLAPSWVVDVGMWMHLITHSLAGPRRRHMVLKTIRLSNAGP